MTRKLAFGLDREVEILEATNEEREGLEDGGDVLLWLPQVLGIVY